MIVTTLAGSQRRQVGRALYAARWSLGHFPQRTYLRFHATAFPFPQC